MALEKDVVTVVKIKGALVVPPEMDYTSTGQARCRLSFPKKCSGEGELNQKPFWLQVVTFGDLAEACARQLHVGLTVVVVGHINANRWYAADGITVKTSQNYIAYRVGIQGEVDKNIDWLAARLTKVKKPDKQPPLLQAEDERAEVDKQVDDFIAGAEGDNGESVPF